MKTSESSGTQTYRVLGLLLTYPGRELISSLDAFREVLDREALLNAAQQDAVDRLSHELETTPLLDLQETYVALFDQTRSVSLHLFEHIHGDSGERGQAMADLKEVYQEHGLIADQVELPDYLPLFCEFVSTLSPVEASQMLGEMAPLLELLATRLEKRPSGYSVVLRALSELAGGIEVPLSQDDDVPVQNPSLGEMDRDWNEPEVNFGAGDALDDCGSCPSNGVSAASSPEDLLQLLASEGSSTC